LTKGKIALKHFERLLFIAIAFAFAGGLGYKFLPDFEPVKMIIFSICCLAFGEVFYQIDKKISKK